METNYSKNNADILPQDLSRTPEIGQSIADYFEFSQESADKGGMGTVIFCRDKRDKTFYALKTFKDSKINKELFYKEADFCLSLKNHPHIVQTKTIAKEGGKIYIVMELLAQQPKDLTEKVQSRTLDKYLKTLESNTALKYAVELCRGMEYLSSLKGFISHNDIKPQNIFITQEGHAKIGDFGLQSLKMGKGGTLGYRPPEFFTNKPHDIRSDIYSFGIVLYQMFNAGAFPFKRPAASQKQPEYKLLDKNKIKQSYCGGIIEKCLKYYPAQRYQNFKELEKSLSAQAKQIKLKIEKLKTGKRDYINLYNIGYGYSNIEKYIKAIKYYRQTIKVNPNYANSYNNIGHIYVQLNRHQQSIKYFNKTIILNPEFFIAYDNMGIAKNKLKEYEQAIYCYNQAIKLNPAYVNAYFNCAIAKYNLHQYKESIEYCNQAIRLSPKDADSYYNRGVAKLALKQYKQAFEDFNKTIILDSKFTIAYYNCGNIMLKLGQHRQAIKYYNQAIGLNKKYFFLCEPRSC